MAPVRVSGTPLFNLERSGPPRSRERSAIFVSGCLRSRMLSIRFADSVAVASLRPSRSARRSSDGLLSLIELSARESFGSVLRAEPPARSRSERSLVAFCLVSLETDGALLLMKSPMRERDSPVRVSLLEIRDPREELRVWAFEVSAWPPGATPDFATVGADGLVVFSEVPRCLPGFVLVSLDSLPDLVTEGVRAVIESPMRDVILRLMRPLSAWGRLTPDPAAEFLLESETEGAAAVTELLAGFVVLRAAPLLTPRLGAPADLEADGVLAVMELPMLEVKPELTLPESLFDSELTREGVLALLPGLETDGVPKPIEPPMRDVTAESIRPLELRTLELGDVGRPTFEELEDGAGTEGATGAVRLEMLGPTLRGALGALEREGEDTDGLGATVMLGLLRPDELEGLEKVGARTERELILLLELRL